MVMACPTQQGWIRAYPQIQAKPRMEGGGEWLPVNDVDYTGSDPDPKTFDGAPISFDDIVLELANGW